jgi:ribokinase
VRAVVVGHVEWVDFIRVERMPIAGEIVHALDHWAAPAGGGPVAAAQLARLAGSAALLTALGDDELGGRARAGLEALGLRVEAALRAGPTRRAVTHLDAAGERTITVLGDRLEPRARDPLPWDLLDAADVCYVAAADPAAVRLARRARTLVATVRILPALAEAGVVLDALVGSAADPAERYRPGDLDPPPRLLVLTEGARGGRYAEAGGGWARFAPAPVPGPVVDAYGCGDSFAAGLAFALARGAPAAEAVAFAARCGAAVLAGRGPYETQLAGPAEDLAIPPANSSRSGARP